MNTKKITALALAALMAAGTTTAAFAEATKKDQALVFTTAAAYEENDDGLLVLDDGVVNPGDSLYFLLEDGAHDGKGITDKERDRINVYADWKLGKEYIDVCKAKGLPARKVISKHALKNALSSILTMLGMQFASLLRGSVITETVFAWPGVGRLVIQSITSSDFAVVECIVFLMAVVFVVINFVVDILYCVINPRIRLQ